MLDEVLSAVDQTSRELWIDRLGPQFFSNKAAIVVTLLAEMLRICSDIHEMKSTSAKRMSKVVVEPSFVMPLVEMLRRSSTLARRSGSTLTSASTSRYKCGPTQRT
jgi:hypothetical protein